MKRFLQWIALAAAMLSITSCGLPGALARSAGSLYNSLGSLAGPAASVAASAAASGAL